MFSKYEFAEALKISAHFLHTYAILFSIVEDSLNKPSMFGNK